MTQDESYRDEFEDYERRFGPLLTDRRARRSRKPEARHVAKKLRGEIVAELADATEGLEGGEFKPTYQPGEYEATWLLVSLRSFYERGLITDVLALVKGGKEASVYRCAGRSGTDIELVAAKVYRPRKFRNLRNDALYREGRAILKEDGQAVNASDDRLLRAVGKKTGFGLQVEHTSWLMYEYTTLDHLYCAGAAVPRPIAASKNAILMSYHGDAHRAAPTLNEVHLGAREATRLLHEALRNIELMLGQHLIHGDLSAYNMLYWQGKITLIDFPQVVNSRTHRNAYKILQRDITRVCEYFSRQGAPSDPVAILQKLWERYVGVDNLLLQEQMSLG